MSNWRPDFQPEHLYFVTTKAVDYAHLFQRDVVKRLLVDAFDCFRARKRLKLFCYIHNNPCQPHWGLSATPAEYIWSSARFYLTDEPCIIPIDDARRLLN